MSGFLILRILSGFFVLAVSKTCKGTDINLVCDYLGVIGMEGHHEELSCLLNFAHARIGNSNKSVTCTRYKAILSLKHKDVYPAASEAAGGLLLAPVSSVDYERGSVNKTRLKPA